MINVLKSKIHQAVVTQAELDYFGSITINDDLLKASGSYPFEKVLVTNMRDGSRLETYTLRGTPGSGVVCLNEPSVHFFQKGDEILIMAFKMITESAVNQHQPIVIFPKIKTQLG